MKSILLIFLLIPFVTFLQEHLEGKIGKYTNDAGVSFKLVSLVSEEFMQTQTPSNGEYYYYFTSEGRELKGFGFFDKSNNKWIFCNNDTKVQLGYGVYKDSLFELNFNGMKIQKVIKKEIPKNLQVKKEVNDTSKTSGYSVRKINLKEIKKTFSIDLSGSNLAKTFEQTPATIFLGKNNSMLEIKKDLKLYSHNKGDYHVYLFRLSLISNNSSEYSEIYGTFRIYEESRNKSDFWSEINGCSYKLEELVTGWIFSLNSDSTASCIGGTQFIDSISNEFVSEK